MIVSCKIRELEEPTTESCLVEGCTETCTHEISGEEDSFGAEWHPGCHTHCLETQKEWNKPSEDIECEKCGGTNNVRPSRDPEEGSHGPVYDWCADCRKSAARYMNDY